MALAQRIACTMDQPLLDLGLPYEQRVPPGEFLVWQPGINETEKGEFLFDDKAALLVMEAWARRAIDLSIDYEHQSQSKPPVEAPNAATKWVPQIRDGALWATEVHWTDRAAGYLRAGEYRYFSPAFEYDPDARRITAMINLALTNNPAMRGIRPLVAATNREENVVMEEELKRLRAEVAELRLEIGKRDAKIAELTAGDGESKELAEGLTATLSLGARARAREQLTAVQEAVSFRSGVRAITGAPNDHAALGILAAWKGDHEKVETLTAQVRKQEEERVAAEFEALLDQAGGKDAKLEPAKREEIRKLATLSTGGKITSASLETAKGFLSMMGPAVSTKGTDSPPTGADQGGAGPGGFHPIHAHIRSVLGRDDRPPTGQQQQ